ncbi:glutamate--tRNA ligase [Candidatus Saccharibacteria bacterium]|nr:glutamate--tRNA ligase [Candidatus Saccharibacteria bacterium]
MKVVTRFAPSPTGYIHIGNLRSAIYPYLLAKQNEEGSYILRIEDTDQARYVEGATELIEDTLQWIGLDWDEGPIKGGDHGPYFQTQRKEIYIEWAKKLIAKGRAYADPTPSEQIAKYREETNKAKKAFLYRNYRPENTPEWEPGMPLRFKADPKDRDYHDEVFGDLHMGPETQDDIILIKADGLPTYNFAHIVDDATMGITHIFRGQEYLPSMGNYLALYEALGVDTPKFVHLPHILAPAGNKKLGKRDGAKSAVDYRADGILPEAMLNFLACLGWNDGTEDEIYSKQDLIEKFSLDRIQRAGARYDEQKLIWLNGQWIRRLFTEDPKALFARTKDFWPEIAAKVSEEEKYKVFCIIYDRLKTLSDLRTMTTYFFEDPNVDMDMLTTNKALKKLSEKELCDILKLAADGLAELNEWSAEMLQNKLNELLEKSGQKPAVFFGLVRLSVSFAPFSPALHDTLSVLGREKTLARLHAVITAFGRD